MAVESKYSLMGIDMMDFMPMESPKVMEFIPGKMGLSIKDNLKME